ncbi:hypothetical protein FMEXI_5077 [Fusarium mexicanum]|uniref:Uncharacterized protein n=1 Tax=Fusarium mexicanum TaxID=751941 RepID=A0A8H5J3V0_9HYPO|nr:hypothetical protein FMEXI_5077 [Fusarium mexicanum]
MEIRKDMRLDESVYVRDVVRLLRRQFPPPTEARDVGYQTQHLDCLIVLLRYINSHMTPHYLPILEEHRAQEAQNPILALSWMDINPDAKPAWIEAKRNILSALGPMGDDESNPSFGDLLHSDIMMKTFWSRQEFKLMRGIMIKPAGGSWDMPADNPDLEKNFLYVARSPLPELSFQDRISRFFQLSRRLADDSQFIRLCARPNILRVTYERQSGFQPYPLSTMKNIKIPIADVKNSKPTKERDHDVVVYTLLAVVSHKDAMIRLYQPMAPQVLFNTTHPVIDSKRWSLEDPEHGIFDLIYAYVGHVEIIDVAGEFAETRELPEAFKEVYKQFQEDIVRFHRAREGGA